jgi:ABC-type transport system substrate-binding protein
MKHLFRGSRRKVAAVMAVALVASLSQVAPTNAISKANNLVILVAEKDADWCSQGTPGLDQVLMKNSVAETLTILNSSGKVVPYLAQSVKSSADFKTWDIKLREGIKYHDGEELTALNVQSNIASLAGLRGPGLPAIAWQDLFGGITSLAQLAAKAQVVDKYTIRFNLPLPRPDVAELLYGNGRAALWSSATLTNTAGCGKTMGAGTGPFKIKSKGTDQFTTVLEANTSYWRKAADGSKLPKAKTVTFKVVLDSTQRVNALDQGSADISTFGATAGAQINRLKGMRGKISLFEGPRDTTWGFHFNTYVAPFNSKNARLAVQYAVDRDAVVKVMTKGNADAATSFGANYHPYYLKNSGVKYDLAKAKEYVAAYKAETGKDLTVVIPITDTTESLKYNDFIGKQLEKAGIKYSLMPPVTSTAYITRGFGLRQQWSSFNVVAGRDAAFATLFSTATDLELSGFRLTDPTLAKCFSDARAVKNGDFKSCMRRLHDNAYWSPVYSEGGFVAARKGVTGIGATPLPGGGSRPVVGLAGFDFASVTVTG